ncbi:hypothetical protein ACNKHV_25525 [Shigella flexneri]
MTTSRASGQEIRPLKVLILKPDAEEHSKLKISFCACFQTDLCRSIFSCCALIPVSRNTPAEHLYFYCNFEDIQDQNFATV